MKGIIEKYNKRNNLFTPKDKLLLAISGGIDSMVMLDVFSSFHNEIAVIHCNFELRSKESDKDEILVKQKSKEYGLKCFTASFDTEKYAEDNKLSIQMAARELRYEYFEEIAHKHTYTKILTAHHLDDNIETFFIHLLRSSGLKGLQGIPSQRGKYIRPLLAVTREEISHYAEKNSIQYREDKSNASTKYLRNQIRHQLSPVLEEIDSQYRKKIEQSMQYIKQSNAFMERELNHIIDEQEIEEGKKRLFLISFLQNHSDSLLILHYWLFSYGFTEDNIQNILRNVKKIKVGRIYYSTDFMLLIDRQHLVLSPVNDILIPPTIIRSQEGKIHKPISLEWKHFEKSKNFKISSDQSQAFLDADKIEYPLILRKWKDGDRFQPLGMKGEKKVSDFLIDIKLNLIEKKEVFVLVSEGEIAWVVGYRISDKYKIKKITRKILHIKQ